MKTLCPLDYAAGLAMRCPGDTCPFWVDDHCAVARRWESFGSDEGQRSMGGLIEGSDGFFYGANAYGGRNNLGTVYRMSRLGRVSAFHQFEASDVGAYPHASLLRTDNGRNRKRVTRIS